MVCIPFLMVQFIIYLISDPGVECSEKEARNNLIETVVGGEVGGTEFTQTFDAIWEAHVQQLMPCKMCGRTFFPDRITIHQKSCRGSNNVAPLRKPIPSNKSNNQAQPAKIMAKTNMDPKNVNSSKLKAAENLSDDHKMLLASPQPVRRQLHQQQDAVVVVSTKDKVARIRSLGNSQDMD